MIEELKKDKKMSREIVKESVESLKTKGDFDAKKVKKIRKAWSKGLYRPNSELIAYVLFNS